jgi:hypothetical protein
VPLRSHYRHLQALPAVALIAVVGLTVTAVILASDSNEVANTTPPGLGGIRYGGFKPATGQPESAPLPQQHTRCGAGSGAPAPTAAPTRVPGVREQY